MDTTLERPPKLLDQLRQRVRALHYSIRTEESYVDWARRFILFHGKRGSYILSCNLDSTFRRNRGPIWPQIADGIEYVATFTNKLDSGDIGNNKTAASAPNTPHRVHAIRSLAISDMDILFRPEQNRMNHPDIPPIIAMTITFIASNSSFCMGETDDYMAI